VAVILAHIVIQQLGQRSGRICTEDRIDALLNDAYAREAELARARTAGKGLGDEAVVESIHDRRVKSLCIIGGQLPRLGEGRHDAISDHAGLEARKLSNRVDAVPSGDLLNIGIARSFGLMTELSEDVRSESKYAFVGGRQAEQIAAIVDLGVVYACESLQSRQHGRDARTSAEAGRSASGQAA